jgi:hypothetical protein
VIKKGDEKTLKYKDLIREIQHMWNVKARVITVIKEVTGTMSKSLRQYLSNIPGKQNLGITQNSHSRHCKHTMESANVKVQNIFHWLYNITCSTNCKYRTAAKLNTLEK